MKWLFRFSFPLFFVFLTLASCQSSWHTANTKATQYRINPESQKDSSFLYMLQPYYHQMAATMEKVIAVSDVELIKKQPSCNMGNFFVDIVKYTAEKVYKMPVDLAVFNHGGMRLTSLAPGNVTLGKIYELSPFDNYIVLLKLNGKVLQEFLDLTAVKGGWPVAGCTYFIKNKKAINVLINGSPVDTNKTYTVATIDYVANGGDDANMLRTIPQLSNKIIMREAIISYLQQLTAEGKHIVDNPEKRVQYAG